jgi:signal transduction histidine kinase/CheY-like chemotaxis protein
VSLEQAGPGPERSPERSASRQQASPDALAALEGIVDPALAALALDDQLATLLSRLVAGSSGRAAALYLLDGGRLTCRAQVEEGLATSPGDQAEREAFAGQVVRNQRALLETEAPGRGRAIRPFDPKLAGRRLGVPLLASGRGLGAVLLELPEARPFPPEEARRLETLADRARCAVQQAQLERQNEAYEAALDQARIEAAGAAAELRQVDRLKTEFLSMVSHELRTPLTAIIGYTDLLLRGTHGGLNVRQQRYQTSVKQASQRLLALIDDLLDVSRLQSGLIDLELGEVNLADLFERTLAGAQETAALGRQTLRVDLPNDLPPVQGDAQRLVQVLDNLLSNALKFTPSGGRVELWAEPTAGRERVRVSVADSGVGIAPEHLAHIWDRFYQADSSARRRHGGSGLGLTIVRHLVEMHGGIVSAASPGLGLGATFSFEIPVAVPANPLAGTDQRRPAAPRAARVLVVEDERDNRELISTLLEEMLEVEVITASDGVEALEQVARQPNLILLDLMLPRLDGFEVARRLKADPRTWAIPIVALTALTHPAEQQEALVAGCDAVLVKPFDTGQLIDEIGARLGLAQRR